MLKTLRLDGRHIPRFELHGSEFKIPPELIWFIGFNYFYLFIEFLSTDGEAKATGVKWTRTLHYIRPCFRFQMDEDIQRKAI